MTCPCADEPRLGCGECGEAGRLGICVGCDEGCYCCRELDAETDQAATSQGSLRESDSEKGEGK